MKLTKCELDLLYLLREWRVEFWKSGGDEEESEKWAKCTLGEFGYLNHWGDRALADMKKEDGLSALYWQSFYEWLKRKRENQ